MGTRRGEPVGVDGMRSYLKKHPDGKYITIGEHGVVFYFVEDKKNRRFTPPEACPYKGNTGIIEYNPKGTFF